MVRKIIPLRPQKQIDQAIKNFILDKSLARNNYVKVCLGGNTAIRLVISEKDVRAYRTYKGKYVFLGHYYSEELVTDPALNDYKMPPEPYFTYGEIIKRGEEVSQRGYVLSNNDLSRVTSVTRPAPSIRQTSHPSLDVKATASKPEFIGGPEKKGAVSASPKSKENDKETLERRLRLLDLKIEREEILNQLAAL